MLLAKHLKIDFKVSMRKQTIKNLVIDKLVDTNIFGEEILELKVESVDALKLKQLELNHVFKIKTISIRKTRERKKGRARKTRTWNKEYGNVGKGETSRMRV